MSESIINELLLEIKELRESLKEENVEVKSLSGFNMEVLTDGVKISGILLAPGVWNGIAYPENELKKMFEQKRDSLLDMPVKVEHERDPEFNDRVVGKIVNVDWDDTLRSIVYEAIITDPLAIQKLKEGIFTGTSLKLSLKKFINKDIAIGRNLEPIDNSLTRYPACSSCVITYYQELSKTSNYYGIYPDNDLTTLLTNPNELINEKKMDQNVYVLPDDEIDSDLEEEIELESIPIEEAIKNGRVIYGLADPDKPKKKVKRTKGYHYYDEEYPYYPYYYPYYYPKVSKKKIKSKTPRKITEDDLTEDDIEILREYKIVKNKKTGKYIVFEVPDQGLWKILKTFDTEDEAREYIKRLSDKQDTLTEKVDLPNIPTIEETQSIDQPELTEVKPTQDTTPTPVSDQKPETVSTKEPSQETTIEPDKPVTPKEPKKININEIIEETSKSLDKLAELIFITERRLKKDE